MLTRLTAGTLQYIGGQLSHQGAVTTMTPAVAVGVRGGTVTVAHGANGTTITSQYGTITLTNAAGSTVVTQPGFTVTIANWKTQPGQPVQVTAAEVDRAFRPATPPFCPSLLDSFLVWRGSKTLRLPALPPPFAGRIANCE